MALLPLEREQQEKSSQGRSRESEECVERHAQGPLMGCRRGDEDMNWTGHVGIGAGG